MAQRLQNDDARPPTHRADASASHFQAQLLYDIVVTDMLWLAWIIVAVICAVLFSVIKTLDRVTFALQLLDSRLDRMAAGLEELKTTVNASHAMIERGPSPHAALGPARSVVQGTTRRA